MSAFQIIGILNVTPDSYFDGGKYDSVSAVVERAGSMLAEGADWIEVGGESTGPKSQGVSLEEELERVIPVIRAIREKFPDASIAVDTWKAEVARQAIEAGAGMVNDVTAGRGCPASVGQERSCPTEAALFSVVKNMNTLIVLMHAKDPTPRTTVAPVQYDDVIVHVKKFLRERKDAAVRTGIDPKKIILDPGLGHFVSSTPKYSFELLAQLEEFRDLSCPILVSPSRKSFLAGKENLPPSERLPGTIAASVVALLHGASYLRTHDVREIRRACEVAEAILHGSQE